MKTRSTAKYVGMGPFFRALQTNGRYGIISGSIKLSESAYKLIAKHSYRGTSAEINVEKYVCAKCGGDYEDCPHSNVNLVPRGIEVKSLSLVRKPRAGTYLTDVLAIKTTSKHKHYRWTGFASGAKDRESWIMERMQSGDLSEAAATYFMKYFESRNSGECRYVD